MFIRVVPLLLALLFLPAVLPVSGSFAFPNAAPQARELPQDLKEIQIQEHLGDRVSIRDLQFKDESGKTVVLADYFRSGRPVILNLGYYGCPTLCGFMVNSLVKSLKGLNWTPGKEFEIVSVSIDPREDAELASKKKASAMADYGRPEAQSGWHFLTAEEAQARKLAKQVGFGYRYNPQDGQYAHGAAIFVLTPEGKISRYLYGIEYPSKDLRLALLEASNGKIGGMIDRLILFCYQYNPITKKYSVYSTRLMQSASLGTVVIFGGYLAVFWRRQRRKGSELHV